MAPEQARGHDADRRADIWAFGVTFYEMLTGRQMFGGETVSDTLAAVLKTDPDWARLPPEAPPAIRRLLRRALERDRKRRLPDIADARLEIDEALAGSPESPAPVAPVVPGNSDLIDRVEVDLSSSILVHPCIRSLVRDLLGFLPKPRIPST
jgi:serine/threonine protein kinase